MNAMHSRILGGTGPRRDGQQASGPLAGWALVIPNLLTDLVWWLLLLLAISLALSDRLGSARAEPPEGSAKPMDVRPAR